MEEKLTNKKNNIEIRPLSSIQPKLHPKLHHQDEEDHPEDTVPVKRRNGYLQQHLATIIVSLLPFMFGTAIGWTAPTMTSLQSPNSPIGQKLTTKETSLIGTLMFAGGIFGTLLWSRIADNFGRKIAGYSVAIIFLIGWIIIEFSYDKYALFIGRFILGISGTGSLIICPLIISELADDAIRGMLGSFVILFMNAGTLTSYAVGAAFSYRILTGICLAIPILYLILFLWLPETPIYLWRKGDTRSAETSLLWFRGGNINKVQEEIIKFSQMEINSKSVTYPMLFSTKANRKAMLIGFGLFAGQQFCGILALLTYTTSIFEQSGSSINSNMSTILVGVFQLFASGISSLIVEKTGRRLLILISFLSMGISLTVLGLYFYIKQSPDYDLTNFSWLPVVALCIYVVVYALGVGPLPYVVITEILSPDIRALATSCIVFWGTALTTICVQIFPLLIITIGNHGNFWFFAFCSYLGFLFTLFIVPETKGIPLIDMLAKLNGKSMSLI